MDVVDFHIILKMQQILTIIYNINVEQKQVQRVDEDKFKIQVFLAKILH